MEHINDAFNFKCCSQNMTTIPTIDFSSFLCDEDTPLEAADVTLEQKNVCEAINHACRDHGFVRLVGTGINADDAFASAKELFGLPDDEKQRIKRIDPDSNMGYSPFASKSLNSSRPPELKEAMNVRFLHATPCAFCGSVDDATLPLRVGEHTDFGAVTFLFYDDTSEGLQIKPVRGGEACYESDDGQAWQSINAPSILVNTGGLMARWTNDEWRATAHRVVVESAEAAQKHRYSIAFFVDPDADVNVQVHESFCRDKPCLYKPINSLDYLLMKLNEAQLLK